MKLMSIAESLEEYAVRTRGTRLALAEVYEEWHEHGNAIAKAWDEPCRRIDPNDHRPHVTISGGKSFGLLPTDIASLVRQNGYT